MKKAGDSRAAAQDLRDMEARVAKLEQWCAGAYLWIDATSKWLKAHKDGGGEIGDPPKPPPPKPYP